MTVIAVFRKFHVNAESFKIAGINGCCQIVNLVSGVINVIFAGNIVASCFH